VTVAEACLVIVDSVRELAATRAERDTWRLLAMGAIGRATELARENAMIASRQYVYRRHSSQVISRNHVGRPERVPGVGETRDGNTRQEEATA
jgi:hypothetical protein